MSKREEMRIKDKLRKQNEINEFINDINILHDNIDSVKPSIGIKKEQENNYINYFVTKHPNCLTYDISMYKKEYPFNIYYSKQFYKNDIPKKYKEEFEELEKYFNNVE